MEEKIKAFARSIGAGAVGITRNQSQTGSVIVCMFPYFHASSGNISIHADGKDYHTVVSDKLRLLSTFIASLFPDASLRVQVDKGDPVDRKYAYESGIGFYGKNGLIINSACGSFGFIGFCEAEGIFLTPDVSQNTQCMACKKCQVVCPGGAITDEGFRPEKCASFISQKRGTLSLEEANILIKSGMVWGCDACQSVCPHNRNILPSIPELRTLSCEKLTSSDLEALSNREFQEKYKDFSFAWRGKAPLLRNLRLLEEEKEEK